MTLKSFAKDSSGVAIILVMGAITILTALMVQFTFDSTIHKRLTINSMDKLKAKLNAQAGLNLALGRLRLYQEGINLLEKNADLKKQVPSKILDLTWSVPFMVPIPIPPKANIIQKDAIADFQKNTLLQGKMQVSIQGKGHLLNLNLLRIHQGIFEEFDQRNTSSSPLEDEVDSTDQLESAEKQILELEKTLTQLLTQAFEEKKESDESFDQLYGDTDPGLLIKTLKYYISDRDSFEDERQGEITSLFDDQNQAKFAPLSSLSELSLVPGWKDAIIDLIKNEITVYGGASIDLNSITQNFLKLLIPEIEKEDLSAFFKYRDDPEDPHSFNSEEEFIAYMAEEAAIISREELTKRFEKLKVAGLHFGPLSTLFEVHSTGISDQISYNLQATVVIPAKPLPPPPIIRPNQEGKCPKNHQLDQKKNNCYKVDDKGKAIPPPKEFLPPRVVSIQTH